MSVQEHGANFVSAGLSVAAIVAAFNENASLAVCTGAPALTTVMATGAWGIKPRVTSILLGGVTAMAGMQVL